MPIFHDREGVSEERFIEVTRDRLTGLPNRLLFEDRLRIALAQAKRHRHIAALYSIDLDRFREVNDQLGRKMADKVLAALGYRWSRSMRAEDTIARVQEDEFVVLSPHLRSVDYAVSLAKRLSGLLQNPFYLDEKTVQLSASIGVSLFPLDAEDPETLFKRAYTAMSWMKKRGGGGFEFFGKWETKAGVRREAKIMGKRSILIVEDDEDFRFLLNKRLQEAGYSCTACESVEQAMDRLEETTPPDLVILDLGFRSASGIALLQNLTRCLQEAEKKAPPVLVVSGYSDPEIVDFATNLGAQGFLAKPINDAQFLSTVRSLIH